MDIVSHVSGVYAIICVKNGKRYIGSSFRVRIRCCAHKNMLRNGTHHNKHLQSAWNKYGENAFQFTLIENVSREKLLEREQWWIEYYQACNDAFGFNLSVKAGAPMAGLLHSTETKSRMSQSQTGRKHTDEVRQKISKANAGRKKSPEHIEKMRAAFTGRKASPETRAKLREVHTNPSAELRFKMGNGMRGKKRTPESLQKAFAIRAQEFIVTDPDGNEYHIKGLAAFCREHGLDQGAMSHVMCGRQKTHKGWRCKRV